MFDSEISEIARLIGAMVDTDIERVTDIHLAPGTLTVTTKNHHGDRAVVVTTEIPWKYKVEGA